MEFRKIFVLNQVDIIGKLGFAFLPWREKKCALTTNDWEMLMKIACELFLLDGYNPSAKRIKNQLKRHMERLRDHEIKVMILDADEGEVRWNSWDTMFQEAKTRKINVSLISWKEPILNIIVQPFRLFRPVVEGGEEDILTLLLPWKRPGFRGMGVGFTGWLIQNIARTLKPDDYYLGWGMWSFILERLIGRSTLSQRDRLIIEELYHFFKGIKPNPDYYWEF